MTFYLHSFIDIGFFFHETGKVMRKLPTEGFYIATPISLKHRSAYCLGRASAVRYSGYEQNENKKEPKHEFYDITDISARDK